MAAQNKSSGWRWLFWLVVFPVLLFALYTWFVLWWSYAEGERVGYVQKLSKRGWLCKTWEGEIALVTMPGTVAEKFLFTVPDEAVAKRINDTMGKRVRLDYRQHIGVPSSCFGDTEYFVYDVAVVEEPTLEPGASRPVAPPVPATGPGPATPAGDAPAATLANPPPEGK
jgi:hypothetical protein